MQREIRLFFTALMFLTRVPVPAWVGYQPQWLQDSVRHFPGVGVLVGGFGALVFALAVQAWPPLVAVALCMAATIWLTGAFHEDGLADTCDALGGSVSRERSLEIMKDSRIGTYGSVALICMLGLKAAALHALALGSAHAVILALPLAHAWSRLVPVLLLRALSYAGDAEHAKAKPMSQQASDASLGIALLWCALAGLGAAAAGLTLLRLAFAAGVAIAVCVVMGRWLRRRLGGYTGDTLGAAQQFAEVAIYLALLAHTGAA